ncbi:MULTISPECIES: nucleotidyltransferase domain-containing protein [Protofrankia]|nr:MULTISPECIES: nucleotidyltransferase domain-containing protein [Protofrankia]
MDKTLVTSATGDAVAVLRQAGAQFAYLHGSRAVGGQRADSDIDIAAFFGGPRPPGSFDILLPPGVDLLVLDSVPLELAGRIAAGGRLLFEDDRGARVRWEAMTRKIYFDELPRSTRAHREFAAAVLDRNAWPVVDEVRVLRLLRAITDDLSVLRHESGAGDERRADPIWLRGVKSPS